MLADVREDQLKEPMAGSASTSHGNSQENAFDDLISTLALGLIVVEFLQIGLVVHDLGTEFVELGLVGPKRELDVLNTRGHGLEDCPGLGTLLQELGRVFLKRLNPVLVTIQHSR
jgi:hypothetical protein